MTKNTLLSRLNVRDTDRSAPAHDEGCRRWFCEPESMLRSAGVLPTGAHDFAVSLEHPVRARRGAVVTGFLDALITFSVPGCCSVSALSAHPDGVLVGSLPSSARALRHLLRGVPAVHQAPDGSCGVLVRAECLWTVLVEVKTGAVDMGAWLRQLRLYGEAVPADARVLSSVAEIDDADARIFASAGWTSAPLRI